MKELSIGKRDAGQRTDKYLQRLLPSAGRGFLYAQMRKKNITLNGAKIKGGETLREGDVVRIFFSDETFAAFRKGKTFSADDSPESYLIERRILYESRDIIIIDKPAGMPVQSDASGKCSLTGALRAFILRRDGSFDGTHRPSPVHRIDRNTSGAVVCAKTSYAARLLRDMTEKRMLGKRYLAMAKGEEPLDGVYRHFGMKDEKTRITHVAAGSREGYDEMVTEYRTLLTGGGHQLVEARLITGRSHQIRSQLAFMGHSLAGDVKYGGETFAGSVGQLLHAYGVSFPEKETAGETDACFPWGVEVTAPVPEIMKRFAEEHGMKGSPI